MTEKNKETTKNTKKQIVKPIEKPIVEPIKAPVETTVVKPIVEVVKKRIIVLSSANKELTKITTDSLEMIGFPIDVVSVSTHESDDTLAIVDCLAKDEFEEVLFIIKAGCVCLEHSYLMVGVLKSIKGNVNNVMPYAIAKIELEFILSKSNCEKDYYERLATKKHIDTSALSDNIIASFSATTTPENALKYSKSAFFLDFTNYPIPKNYPL